MEPTEEDLMRGFTGIVMNGPFERRGPPQTFRDTFVSLPWTATDRADASELDMTAKSERVPNNIFSVRGIEAARQGSVTFTLWDPSSQVPPPCTEVYCDA